ncbi:MAG: aminotransferase class III-fold pyridoxal phosphate-dependent enzyme, partial [Verrucomicrobiales bacterium]|nr:aminotransferase class III-fold pyridoxal phosphate-dependent enzyme [Verrucomicrobiales bacterium]
MNVLARLDHAHVWHPFTQMREWLRREPIVIVSGRGAVLRDVRGREYLDANASIWTNLHGHNHPRLNAALRRQLSKIAHSSALGLANEPASLLAAKLVAAANPRGLPCTPRLTKVFFSDDGSTAVEVALKLAYEFTRRTRGRRPEPRFLSLDSAYHGDTLGAVALGHIDLFHRSFAGLLFKSHKVMSPYCYRCPFNRAKPERADAREYRRCNWECVAEVERKFVAARRRGNPYAGFVFE